MKRFLYALLMFMLAAASGVIAQGGAGKGTQAHDITMQIVNSDLTHNGLQYTEPDTTTTLNTDIVIFSETFNMGLGENYNNEYNWITQEMIDCYFNIIVSSSAVSTGTADIKWQPQARNRDGTWTDLCDAVTVPNPSTTFADSVRKGYCTLSSTFNTVPFDFRIIMQCNETDEGIAKIRSGSYIRAIFKEKI